jgi:hypothetical protein
LRLAAFADRFDIELCGFRFSSDDNLGFKLANCGMSIQLGAKTVKIIRVGANFAKSASDGVSHRANLLLKRTLARIATGAGESEGEAE